VIEHAECAPGRAVVAVRGDAVPTAGSSPVEQRSLAASKPRRRARTDDVAPCCTKPSNDADRGSEVVRSRPLCLWPLVARYLAKATPIRRRVPTAPNRISLE
jgi:hypothetical protein